MHLSYAVLEILHHNIKNYTGVGLTKCNNFIIQNYVSYFLNISHTRKAFQMLHYRGYLQFL